MRLLLDTHVFLWALDDPQRLPAKMRACIDDVANDVYVSAVVAWEIAIKHALGKLRLPMTPETYVPDRISRLGFKPLPISIDHAVAVARLPPIHADPFDRLLVAQARVEALDVMTVDANVLAYFE